MSWRRKSPIYQMKHGDILSAKLEDPKEAPVPSMNNITASKQTISKLTQSHATLAIDPWLAHDPWQSNTATKKPAMPSLTPHACRHARPVGSARTKAGTEDPGNDH